MAKITTEALVLLLDPKKVIYYILLSKTSEEQLAKDIYHSAIEKAIIKYNKGVYVEEGKLQAWFYTIAINILNDYYRKHQRSPILRMYDTEHDIEAIIGEEDFNFELVDEAKHKSLKLLNALKELPSEQQEVIDLYYYRGFSFEEIAKHTTVSINTALGRKRYAIINLKKLMVK